MSGSFPWSGNLDFDKSRIPEKTRMDLLHRIVDLFLHLDQHLGQLIAQYGT